MEPTRVTRSQNSGTQHLRMTVLKCRTQDVDGQVLLKYSHPEMLRCRSTGPLGYGLLHVTIAEAIMEAIATTIDG